ncbi:2-hydroxy-6-oxohepta-2,4-dienoate hydrolase [Sulfurimonas gotlandica GD1]|uniref:2-hydroxy-6-oxohepta-2,4-dienoate hydrolase n=1 Tax=Sulfurimonas gotlandica (strain DSM 19862 / JCM 16533 / GD1) TaxID=929558 RepID=B6BNJ7_SULGG|nr:alpha/beta hydrolase [Sulfurimonas gotlandica]EDZ61307.1 alpha/beta hydrolase fold [Sulfurimonas gotlandica GD1]EHP31070.1 2-hydroxy-6-oxohepta-2,4-dienoate hydrolase [Sulfurimonas gotlandica GD1]
MAIKSIQYNQHTLDVSYEILNPEAPVDLIILHGWGSNKNLMKKSFSSYMDTFRHIYIDLPGFGGSTCNVALETKDYARIVELLMIHINASKDIILGHSFGGKVAVLLEPKVLVLVASAGIYVPKSFKVKAKIYIFKMFKIFGLAKLRSMFVADDAKYLSEPMYQTFKNVVDEDFSDDFAAYNGKALLCWGVGDTATPLSSAQKIDALINDSTLKVYDGDHYFFMTHAEQVSKEIQATFLKTLEHV